MLRLQGWRVHYTHAAAEASYDCVRFLALYSLLDTKINSAHQSSSRMGVMNRNWSATKQRFHPQSVAEISRHSVLSGDRTRLCETLSWSHHKDTDQCL